MTEGALEPPTVGVAKLDVVLGVAFDDAVGAAKTIKDYCSLGLTEHQAVSGRIYIDHYICAINNRHIM